MDNEQPENDDSRRRAFSPPRQRQARRRPRVPALNLWHMREGFAYGVSRAGCAVGFAIVPTVSNRFGDAALAVVSAALAVALLGIVLLIYRFSRPVEWRLVADSATLFVLVPVLVTASGLEVADARFGGRGVNFLAAAAAIVCLYIIVVVIATRGGADRNAAGQIGALPGAFSIVAILMGTTFFSAGAVWRGLSIAWMAAAIVTVVAMLVPVSRRALVAPIAFALFSAAIIIPDALNEGGTPLSSGSATIAMLTTLVVAVVLIVIPIPSGSSRNPGQPPE